MKETLINQGGKFCWKKGSECELWIKKNHMTFRDQILQSALRPEGGGIAQW